MIHIRKGPARPRFVSLLSASPPALIEPAATSSDDEAPDTPPIIQINGNNPAVIEVSATYNDLGATIPGPVADLNLGIQTYLNGTSSKISS